MAIGNALEAKPEGLPASVRCVGIIFCEDIGAFDEAGVARLNAYDLIVAGSRWTERVLREKGVERVVLAHQGYDGRVFFPWTGAIVSREVSENAGKYGDAHDSMATPSRPRVFSGGKLEFRKGQDIVVEAFRRFRQTPEGRDAQLVVAWDNQWPQTMDGIWLSDYVKGVPTVRNGRCEVGPWLVANGLPADAVIDCGRLTPPEAAHVLRSCTAGVFPNRAESGTNLVLVEALASGLPCIMAGRHGQLDASHAFAPVPPWLLDPNGIGLDVVPNGCSLYKSTDGWVETAPDEIVGALALAARGGWGGAWNSSSSYADYWDWSVRGPAMAEAILQAETVAA
jgi:glycosyltransferase involved in cell wall biosynthesis